MAIPARSRPWGLPPPDRLAERLLAARQPSGGWLSTPGGTETVEDTVLALAALEALGTVESDVRDDSRRRLLDLQAPDGGFAVGPGLSASAWATALAGLYLRSDPETLPRALEAADWLLRHGAPRPGLTQRLRRWVFGAGPVDVRTDLVGWSWRPDTFSWVEPTAWASLLLRSVRDRGPRREIDQRLEEVRAFYADRECVGGGWNYGNRAVFDTPLPPNADTTAIALLSAQGWADEPWVVRGFTALDRMMAEVSSPLAYSLSRLARRLHGRGAGGPDAATYQEQNGILPQTRSMALAILADRPHPIFDLSAGGSGRAEAAPGSGP